MGNPVNAILGIKVLGDEKEQDFYIKAPLALDWQRMYASDVQRVGILGQGWMLPLEYELEVQKEQIEFCYRHGVKLYFEHIEIGDESIITKRGFRLLRPDENSYVVVLDDGQLLQFKAYEEDRYN